MTKLPKNSSIIGIIFLWLMSLNSSFSQTPVFYVGPGGTLYIGQGFVYQGGDVFFDGEGRNEDSLILTGNFSSPGKYTSIGHEIFSGPGSKTILTSVKDTNSLGYFVKQNSGNITLSGDVDCDSLFLSNGKVMLTNTDTLRIKSGSVTAIKGYNSSSFVDVDDNAILSRNITSTNVAYVWPYGNFIAGYKRFDMVFSSLGLTGSSFVNGKLVNGSPGLVAYRKYFATGFSGNYPGQPCVVGTSRQWVEFTCMTPNYYNFSGPSDYVSIVTAWSSSCDPGGAGPQRVLRAPIATGDWDNYVEIVVGTLTTQLCENSYWLGGIATSIDGGSYLGFGDFAIGGGYGAPLPVELTAFTAMAIDELGYILLQWSTASELNCKEYILQRSTDAHSWTTIATINGNGTTNEPQSYQYDDYNVVAGIKYYYQVIQIDFDNTPHYDNYISAQLKSSNAIVKDVFPNPGSENQFISIYLPKETIITISCANVLGQEVWNKKVIGVSGNQNILLDDVFAKGLYILQIQIGSEYFVRKFEKQ